MARTKKPESPHLPNASSPSFAPGNGHEEDLADRKQKLKELIDLVIDTAQAKGWNAELVAQDTKKGKYATVSVARIVPGAIQRVSATYEITCDQRSRISYHPTSIPFTWGLSDLYEAIGNEFKQVFLANTDRKYNTQI